jgi:hypothetical protein
VGELVPAACVGSETSIGVGGCYVSTAYGKKLQRSSTRRVCGWRLHNGVLNDANGALSLLNQDTQSLRSDTFAICSSSLASVLESPQGLTRSRSLTVVSLSASSRHYWPHCLLMPSCSPNPSNALGLRDRRHLVCGCCVLSHPYQSPCERRSPLLPA